MFPVVEYEKFAPQFNPTQFNAAEIVALAKSAGMKYITITSKHHDGFAMFGTKQNKWNIVDATPYAKDPLKQLAEECRKQGIKLFFYHSQLDWHNPDYFPLGRTGHSAGRPEGGDFNRYLEFMDAQLTELLTNYGDVAGIWFDGMWDKPDADWQLQRTYYAHSQAATGGADRQQSPSRAVRRRRFSDVRKGFAGREYGWLQSNIDQPSAVGNLRDRLMARGATTRATRILKACQI